MRWAICALLVGCSSGATAETDPEVDAAIDGATDGDDATSSDASSDGVASDVATDTSVPPDSAPKPDALPDIGKACGEPGAKVHAGHCYFPLSPSSYADAKSACAASGAHLVTINSVAEHGFVSDFGGITERWIGLERPASAPNLKESFKWITGEPTTLDRWHLTEPNGTGPCAHLRPDGFWGDGACASLFPALCERE